MNFKLSLKVLLLPEQKRPYAEASGQIIEVSNAFVSGGFFSKGDVLIRIDPRNYSAAVKRAKATVARARLNLHRKRTGRICSR